MKFQSQLWDSFLDEIGEYQRHILDTLREPLETKQFLYQEQAHQWYSPLISYLLQQ